MVLKVCFPNKQSSTLGNLLEMQTFWLNQTWISNSWGGAQQYVLSSMPSDSDDSSSLRTTALEHGIAESYLRDHMLKSLIIQGGNCSAKSDMTS